MSLTKSVTHCGSCGSDKVYAEETVPLSGYLWWLQLRCPNCEKATIGTYDGDQLDELDDSFEQGRQAIVQDLSVATDFESGVERFAKALDDGHILPEDF